MSDIESGLAACFGVLTSVLEDENVAGERQCRVLTAYLVQAAESGWADWSQERNGWEGYPWVLEAFTRAERKVASDHAEREFAARTEPGEPGGSPAVPAERRPVRAARPGAAGGRGVG